MNLTRRSFLGGILAAGVAPAVIARASLGHMRATESGLLVPDIYVGQVTGIYWPNFSARETVWVNGVPHYLQAGVLVPAKGIYHGFRLGSGKLHIAR